ncbi:MAG: hypothetical protein KGQ86_09665 [Bacteroidetes bacterium]|nr:hypothetical protein [Bacteroidota bacterium]
MIQNQEEESKIPQKKISPTKPKTDNREMYMYHGRANAIRTCNNGMLLSVKSLNP